MIDKLAKREAGEQATVGAEAARKDCWRLMGSLVLPREGDSRKELVVWLPGHWTWGAW